MRIEINGEPREVQEGLTIGSLLESLGLSERPRRRRAQRRHRATRSACFHPAQRRRQARGRPVRGRRLNSRSPTRAPPAFSIGVQSHARRAHHRPAHASTPASSSALRQVQRSGRDPRGSRRLGRSGGHGGGTPGRSGKRRKIRRSSSTCASASSRCCPTPPLLHGQRCDPHLPIGARRRGVSSSSSSRSSVTRHALFPDVEQTLEAARVLWSKVGHHACSLHERRSHHLQEARRHRLCCGDAPSPPRSDRASASQSVQPRDHPQAVQGPGHRRRGGRHAPRTPPSRWSSAVMGS